MKHFIEPYSGIFPKNFLCQFDEQLNLYNKFLPREVIFNDPATIVLWFDGSKTIVKCGADDTFDKEKGLALCFMKKALDNKSSFNNVLKEFIDYEDS